MQLIQKRVSQKTVFKVVWPQRGYADSVGVKLESAEIMAEPHFEALQVTEKPISSGDFNGKTFRL